MDTSYIHRTILVCAVALCFLLSRPSYFLSVSASTVRLDDASHQVAIGLLQLIPPRPSTAAEADNMTAWQQFAAEQYVATSLAIAALNADEYPDLLPGYTFHLAARDTATKDGQSTIMAHLLMDAYRTPNTPPIVLGMLDYSETYAIGMASQPFQTPLLSATMSTPSLTSLFPNFQRYVNTDMFESFALISLINSFGWTKIVALHNDDAGTSTQLVSIMQSHTSLAPNLNIFELSYTHSITTDSAFPDISTQLSYISLTSMRIILLSAPAEEAIDVLKQAAALGLVGAPYQWIASNSICYDETLFSDPTYGYLFDGMLCTEDFKDTNSAVYKRFKQRWTDAYNADPASTYFMKSPKRSAASYDAVLGAAQALNTLAALKATCNLTVVGSGGYPFSGLIPPDENEFVESLYSNTTVSSGDSINYSKSNIDTKAPYVCPYLLYSVGQGRVLTNILRNQELVGATGNLTLKDSGDLVGDISVYSIYSGVRTLVGVAKTATMFAQFGIGGTATTGGNGTVSFNLTSGGQPPFGGNGTAAGGGSGSGGGPMSSSSCSSSTCVTLETYNATTFRPTGEYSSLSIALTLASGATFASNIISDFTPALITWTGGGHTVPQDSPTEVIKFESVSVSVRIAMYVLVGIVSLYSFLLMAFQVWYRNEKLIKMTSPSMNIIFLLGSFGMSMYVILLSYDSSMLDGESAYVRLCHLKYLLLSISFSLAFGSMLAKTHRIDAIFNSKHLRVKAIKDRDILLIVAAFVALDVLICLIWFSVSPFRRDLVSDTPYENPDNINELILNTRDFCTSDNFTIFVAVFLIYKGVMLMFAVYLALRIRKVKQANLNDAPFMVVSIYNVVVIGSALIPIALVVKDKPTTFYVLIAIGIIFLIGLVLSLLFLPRVLKMLFAIDFSENSVTVANSLPGHHDHSSSTDSAALSTLKSEVERLKQLVIQIRSGHDPMHGGHSPQATPFGSPKLSPSPIGRPSLSGGGGIGGNTTHAKLAPPPRSPVRGPVHGSGVVRVTLGATHGHTHSTSHAASLLVPGAHEQQSPAPPSYNNMVDPTSSPPIQPSESVQQPISPNVNTLVTFTDLPGSTSGSGTDSHAPITDSSEHPTVQQS